MRQIFKNKKVKLTLNYLGVIISIIGIVLCFALVSGTYVSNKEIQSRTKNIETKVNEQFDWANEKIDELITKIENLDSLTEIQKAIDEVADINIERLSALNITMNSINLNGSLDGTIKKVDSAITVLETVKNAPLILVILRDESVKQLNIFKSDVNNIRSEFDGGINTIQRFSLYGFLGSFILAFVFLLGEITLFKRCFLGIKNRNVLTPST